MFIKSDAGRSQFWKGEKLDCTVRAFVIAFGVPYDIVHAFVTALGRKPRHRFKCESILVCTRAQRVSIAPRETFIKFLERNPKGRFYIKIKGHCIGVINGCAFDEKPTSKAKVIAAWHTDV